MSVFSGGGEIQLPPPIHTIFLPKSECRALSNGILSCDVQEDTYGQVTHLYLAGNRRDVSRFLNWGIREDVFCTLTTLSICDCRVEGHSSAKVAKAVGKLQTLKVLDASANNLFRFRGSTVKDAVVAWCLALGNLIDITALDLSQTRMNVEVLHSLSAVITRLDCLQVLLLVGNDIGGETTAGSAVAGLLHGSKELLQLDLSRSISTGPTAGWAEQVLPAMSHGLQTLVLAEMDLRSDGAFCLARALVTMRIVVLDISGNNLCIRNNGTRDVTGFSRVCEVLPRELRIINLSNNHLGCGEGMMVLAQGIALIPLIMLDISRNDIPQTPSGKREVQGAYAMAHAMSLNPSLSEITLSREMFFEVEDMHENGEVVFHSTDNTFLVENHCLHEGSAKMLVEFAQRCEGLITVDLSGNHLYGDDASGTRIGSAIGSLLRRSRSLRTLRVRECASSLGATGGAMFLGEIGAGLADNMGLETLDGRDNFASVQRIQSLDANGSLPPKKYHRTYSQETTHELAKISMAPLLAVVKQRARKYDKECLHVTGSTDDIADFENVRDLRQGRNPSLSLSLITLLHLTAVYNRLLDFL